LFFDDDYRGRRLDVELGTGTARFGELSAGQRRAALNHVRIGGGKIFAACCHVNTPDPGVQLGSVRDVAQFQILWIRDGQLAYSKIIDGK
jgi:hypothetical protein